jgi:hypothetical protein
MLTKTYGLQNPGACNQYLLAASPNWKSICEEQLEGVTIIKTKHPPKLRKPIEENKPLTNPTNKQTEKNEKKINRNSVNFK